MSGKAPFEANLSELKRRLKHVSVIFLIFTVLGFALSGELISMIQADLRLSLHALRPYEALRVRILAAVLISFILTLPVAFYHLIKFAEPGLRQKEYRALRNVIPLSFGLFLLGGLFSYFFVFKKAIIFFRKYTFGADVEAIWGLSYTASFAIQLSYLTGLMFQIPVISLLLSKLDIIDAGDMIRYRGYFFVAVIGLSAIATPPDILTQVLVAFPMVGLYQLSIYLVSKTGSY